MSFLKPKLTPTQSVKPLFNVGMGMDIITGEYLLGLNGEYYLNGGIGYLNGVVGEANRFKSTILHNAVLTAMAHIMETHESSLSTYDTETNVHESRLTKLYKKFPIFANRNLFLEGVWTVTDKTIYPGEKWWSAVRTFMHDKITNRKSIMYTTPFYDRDGSTLVSVIAPTFNELDSLTKFDTSAITTIQDNFEIDEAGGNTMHMRNGLAKMRMLTELPFLSPTSGSYFSITAHITKEIIIPTGPIPQAPVKKLSTLKNGDKVKGVTDDFFYLMSACWQTVSANPLLNKTDKTPLYPRCAEDDVVGDLDLMEVTLRCLRSKTGLSGNQISVICSQSEGVLDDLTNFHNIKTSDMFGLSGGDRNYTLDIRPDVKLSRTTVRNKLATDPKLVRAMEITAQLCQITKYWKLKPEFKDILVTPKELYESIITQGYSWDDILTSRGWWTFDDDKHPTPHVSTYDLLRMGKGIFKHPRLKQNNGATK